MDELTVTHWSLLALGALIMGMSKGGIPGAGNLTVAIFALVLENATGTGWRSSLSWFVAPRLDISGYGRHCCLPQTCELEIYFPSSSFLS